MTDRNAVWAAAYGAFCATRAATRAQMFIDPPDASWWERVKADAKAFADAAVADFEEPKPEPAQSPKRDELMDVWVDGAITSSVSMPDWEHYVPYSQLDVANRRLGEAGELYAIALEERNHWQQRAKNDERAIEILNGNIKTLEVVLVAAQRDSELLDAILDTVTAMRRCPFAEIDRHGKRLDNAINRAIAERGKR